MAKSYVTYSGTGALQTLTVSFPYLDRDHVIVLVDDVSTAFTWLTDTSIQVTTTAGTNNVVVKRVTPTTPIVTLSDASGLTASNLNTAINQFRYVAEEIEDAFLGDILTNDSVNTANLQTGSVTNPKLATDAVSSAKIQNAAVITSKIADNNVTLAKTTMGTGKLVGRTTASSGAAEEIAVGSGLSLAALSLAVTSLLARFAASVAAVTSAGSSIAVDTIHYVTGTSANYDITLPAVGASSGKSIAFVVGSFTNANKAYRLDAGAAVEIAGRTRYLTLLHTNVVVLYSDGTRWLPLVLNLDTPWVDAGAITISGTGTAPAKGTTSRDKVQWRRVGQNIRANFSYHQTGAGTNGSGDLLISLPIGTFASSVELDTSAYSTYPAIRYLVNGFSGEIGNGTTYAYAAVYPYGSSTFRVVGVQITGAANWAIGNTGFGLGDASQRFNINLDLPMTDW